VAARIVFIPVVEAASEAIAGLDEPADIAVGPVRVNAGEVQNI